MSGAHNVAVCVCACVNTVCVCIIFSWNRRVIKKASCPEYKLTDVDVYTHTCNGCITSLHKKIPIRNLADVVMSQWMQWLTKYTNKKCHAHSDMHSTPLRRVWLGWAWATLTLASLLKIYSGGCQKCIPIILAGHIVLIGHHCHVAVHSEVQFLEHGFLYYKHD